MKSSVSFILFIVINSIMLPACAETDAVLISIKPMIPSGGIGGTNSVDTGVTIENGDIWIWGFRGSGQQGNGTMVVSQTSTPARVNTFVYQGRSIVQAAAGIYHFIALDDKGDVWSWGQNGYKEAGCNICDAAYVNSPCKILSGKNVIQIGAGEYISYALTQSGDVYTWGHNNWGQQATGGTQNVGLFMIPKGYFDNSPVVQIGAAYEGGYAINSRGDVFGWGREYYDSFGYPNSGNNHITRPKKLNIEKYISGNNIDYICGGHRYTSYLTSDGVVYGIGGLEKLGQGYPVTSSQKTATPVKIMSNIKTLYCRYAGAVAITDDNKIYTWGSNENASDPFHMYGRSPTLRNYHANLVKIDGGKENIYYWTDKEKGYGVGYGAGYKFSQNSVSTVDWPGKELTFVADAMKVVYGKDYIIGQGQ